MIWVLCSRKCYDFFTSFDTGFWLKKLCKWIAYYFLWMNLIDSEDSKISIIMQILIMRLSKVNEMFIFVWDGWQLSCCK